jgi:hypothetical protein
MYTLEYRYLYCTVVIRVWGDYELTLTPFPSQGFLHPAETCCQDDEGYYQVVSASQLGSR